MQVGFKSSCPTFGPRLMKPKGATPIVKVLPIERAQIQRMRMINHSLGSISHAVAVVKPAVTEIPVLCSNEVWIEAAQMVKRCGRNNQIVRSKKARAVNTLVIVFIHGVDYQLAGSGKRIILKQV